MVNVSLGVKGSRLTDSTPKCGMDTNKRLAFNAARALMPALLQQYCCMRHVRVCRGQSRGLLVLRKDPPLRIANAIDHGVHPASKVTQSKFLIISLISEQA